MRSFRRLATVVLVAALACVHACMKVERTTTVRVPASWLGEWQGDWQSRRGASTGTMRLSLQAFESHPIVHVATDNPCLRPANYRFVLRGLQWELLADGEPVFEGVLDPEHRRLAGDYHCTEDEGQWQVSWQRELPPVADLGGRWQGTFAMAVPALAGDFVLDLDQEWVDGALRLSGTIGLPAFGFELPIAEGAVSFDGTTFLLQLRAAQAGTQVLLQGAGHSGEGLVREGVLQVEDPRLPVLFGAWTATWIGP